MIENRFSPARRIFLEQAAVAAASVARLTIPRAVAMAASSSAADQSSPHKVRFNAGDSFVVGNLYLPTGYRPDVRYPAAVVGGSLTTVKEQMGGTYADELARRGFWR